MTGVQTCALPISLTAPKMPRSESQNWISLHAFVSLCIEIFFSSSFELFLICFIIFQWLFNLYLYSGLSVSEKGQLQQRQRWLTLLRDVYLPQILSCPSVSSIINNTGIIKLTSIVSSSNFSGQFKSSNWHCLNYSKIISIIWW